MTFAALRALYASIGHALDELERLYRDHTTSEGLDFPDLDEPYYPSAHHTLAEERAEKLKADPDVAFTIRRIVAACGQMSATVNRTWLGVMDTIQGVSSGGYYIPDRHRCMLILSPGTTCRMSPLHGASAYCRHSTPWRSSGNARQTYLRRDSQCTTLQRTVS